MTGFLSHLEPTKKEKKFKISFDPTEGSYLKIKGKGEFGIRAEIRGEDVRITSFSTRIIVELYVIFFQIFNINQVVVVASCTFGASLEVKAKGNVRWVKYCSFSSRFTNHVDSF